MQVLRGDWDEENSEKMRVSLILHLLAFQGYINV